jgi:6-phosphogluconolactonase
MTEMISTRRKFLAASAALPFALRSFAEMPMHPKWVLLGTDTGAGIYRASWDGATGELGKVELAIAADRPNFFAMHPKLPVMYSTDSVAGANAAISAYRVDSADASLKEISKIGSQGDGPCYVSVDRTGRMAFAADYGGGSFGAFKLGPQGEFEGVAGVLHCNHNPVCGVPGPMKARQDAAYLHCAVISPHNDFVLACNLGEDAIEVFPITPAEQRLGTPTRVTCRPGSGPRHVAFHPNGRWVYCIHEVDATIDLYDWKVRGGKAEMALRPGSMLSTMKPGTPIKGNTGCEVVVGDSGKFVYTCTRGVDEIVIYRVNPASGLLSEHQRLSSGGKVPRMITFDPTRKWMLCSNQGSSNIVLFAHDAAKGWLTPTGKSFAANSPMFVQFV